MDETYQRQIRQMVNFILQEADEKANEIYFKTEHDFSLEKQMKLHQSKLRIQQEYKQKQKAAETQRRIQRSVVTSEVRVRKMVAREDMVQKVKDQTKKKLAQVATADQAVYAELLKKLIVQSLIKLNESKVEVQCREIDARMVQKIMAEAAKTYEQLIAEACHEKVKIEITMSSKSLPGPSDGNGSPSCAGGVKVLAKGGRIICDNTLDSRLNIAFNDLMPVIRQMLFTTPL